MLKRAFDFAASSILLALLSPVLIACAIAVAITMGMPVFFRQKRIGLGEKEFEIIKFRTMRPPKEGELMLLTDADRVTKVGEFLRRTSLDELPELWNVFRGEMSLVGPRPLLDAHLQVFTPEQRRRHLVRPGLTGLAQVSGRQHLTFTQRTALDVQYVDTRSFWGDVVILFRTVGVVLGGSGVETGQVFSDVDDVGLKGIIEKDSKAGSKDQ